MISASRHYQPHRNLREGHMNRVAVLAEMEAIYLQLRDEDPGLQRGCILMEHS